MGIKGVITRRVKWLRRRKLTRTAEYTPRLWPIVVPSLTWLLLVGVAVTWVYRFMLGEAFTLLPWPINSPHVDSATAFRNTVSIVGLVAAVLTAVYAYRKQRLTEAESFRADAAEFTRRYGEALEQLSSERAASRLGGAYAMARLADDWLQQRQTCIDVLCAYLRMPFDPRTADPAMRSEMEVRNSVQWCVEDRLRTDRESPSSWSQYKIDLTGAHLSEADFTGATFGAQAVFTDALFAGSTKFNRSTFNGIARFTRAVFEKDSWWDDCWFHGETLFDAVTFKDNFWCDRTSFRRGVWFSKSQLDGLAHFASCTFGGRAGFEATIFKNEVSFEAAEFSSSANFQAAEFEGATFNNSLFVANAYFDGTRFERLSRFMLATFEKECWFDGATFKAAARFDGTTFVGVTRFSQSEFGGNLWLEGAAFRAEVKFDDADCEGLIATRSVSFDRGAVTSGSGRLARAIHAAGASGHPLGWTSGDLLHGAPAVVEE